MYLAISAAWAVCLAAAIVGWKQTARRLAARERENTALAQQCECFERAGKEQERMRRTAVERATSLDKALGESEDTACELRGRLHRAEEALGLRESEYDEVLRALHDAERVETTLRQDRHRLEEALIAEREAAEYWKEQFQREQAWRLTTEGRIMREVSNLLAYDGTGRGQEDLSE